MLHPLNDLVDRRAVVLRHLLAVVVVDRQLVPETVEQAVEPRAEAASVLAHDQPRMTPSRLTPRRRSRRHVLCRRHVKTDCETAGAGPERP